MHLLLRYLPIALPVWATAQTLVGTSPLPRTALLEEFTALNCGNCPASHAVADELAQLHGDHLAIIGVHGGPLAIPASGQPDLRTVDGTALWEQFDVAFQPLGTIAREGVTVVAQWSTAIDAILADVSPVNIGVSSTYEPAEASLLVHVELYYTGDGPPEDRIHVAITQDHLIAYQQDYVNGPHAAYDHRHVLRDIITPFTGEPVMTTAMGTLIQRDYTIPVPAEWDLAELDVVAFVGEADGAVHQVRSVDADGGATVGADEHSDEYSGLGPAYPVPSSEHVFFPIGPMGAGRLFRFLDASGRVLLEFPAPLDSGPLGLDVSALPAGCYWGGFIGARPRRIIVGH